jgi:hypothetical protein
VFEVHEDTTCGHPVLDRGVAGEASEQADRIGDVWSSSKHGVHERTDDREVQGEVGLFLIGRSWLEDCLRSEGVLGWLAVLHIEASEDRVDVLCLTQGKGALRSISRDLQAKDEVQLSQVLHVISL